MPLTFTAQIISATKPDYPPQYVTGGFTLAGVLLGLVGGYALQQWTKRREEQSKCKRFLQSIHDEVDATLNLYLAKYGAQVEASDEKTPVQATVVQEQDYFTVYSSNASLLGLVENKELRKAIVTTYTKAKGLVDSISLNNLMLEKREEAMKQALIAHANARTEMPVLVQAYNDDLIKFGVLLRGAHYDMKTDAFNLLHLIELELKRF